MVTPDQKESTLISKHPVNYYAVYSVKNQAIIYIGTDTECKRYIQQHELDECEVWHIHDVAIHARPLYLQNME